MCGRFTLRTKATDFANHFGLAEVPDLMARYNIAPTQKVAAIRLDPQQGARQLSMLRWGLIPSWADDPSIGNRLIRPFLKAWRNAGLMVTVSERAPRFSSIRISRRRRQAVRRPTKGRRTVRLCRSFRTLARGDQIIDSCTIITTEANELMAGIHDRMPAILSPDDYDLWLETDFHGQGKLQEMLRPYPADKMYAYPVSTVVNNPRNDSKECLQAVQS